MAEYVSLTLKIESSLKETLKQLARENQICLSQEIEQRLQSSLQHHPHPAIDSQDTWREWSVRLATQELKLVRTLLKKQGKKKK